MSEKQYQQAEEVIRQQKITQIQESMNFAYDSLVSSQAKTQLPENVFVSYFLPFFAGQPVAPGRNVVAEWIGVAGTPMSEVDVVDVSGQVLFTVPAIFNTNILEIANRQAGRSFADIFSEYELRKAGVPIAANGYLAQNLHSKASEIIKGEHNVSFIANQWAMIMSRYGIVSAAAAIANNKLQDTGSDDVMYD
jgi:hypothetical protein